jgi:dTMP kinase
MPARGKLIVLEGIDGSGKHTQLEMLARAMRARGVAHTTVDFPRYDGFFGKMVAQYLNGEFGSLAEVDAHFSALLFAGDRLENKKRLETLLNDGRLVLADRYIASNLAHQGARVRPRQVNEFLRWLERLEYEVHGLPREDLVIYLRLPAARAQKMVSKKNARSYTRRRRDLQEANLVHLKTAAGIFERLARQRNWATVQCAAGRTNQLRSPEEIHRDVMAILQTRVLAGTEDS